MSYLAKGGESFEDVARRTTGDDSNSGEISRSNPTVKEPIPAGTVLNVPNNDLKTINPTNQDITIKIDGKIFSVWSSITFNKTIDSIDSIEMLAPFDHKNPELREAFRPFKYKTIVLFFGDKKVFTGTMVAPQPSISGKEHIVTVSAYSKPGVLMDCTAPKSLLPLEFSSISLTRIAAILCKPFGINVIVDVEDTEVFSRVAVDPTKSIFDFLTELAKQRGILLTNDEDGNLLFQKGKIEKSLAVFNSDLPPIVSVSPTFSAQQYYSEITGIKAAILGAVGSEYTVSNPALKGVLRPFTFDVRDTDGAGIKTAALSKLSRMFGSSVSYDLLCSVWFNSNGDLWDVNTQVQLLAPEIFVFTSYKFTIRSIQFVVSGKTKTARLDLVIPEAFTGELPGSFPWDE